MKHITFTTLIIFRFSALAAALALTACGGGGGNSTTPPVSQTCVNGASDYPTCTPAVTPANLQTSVPTPTYAQSSQELIAFSEINAFRKSMGLGLLAQNANLDKAAQNHANYVVLNQDFSHNENASKQGFTGGDPTSRASFAGYNSTYVGEMIGGTNGTVAARGLMNTIYHRNGVAMQEVVDVGMSLNLAWSQPLVVDIGYGKKGQNNASDFITTYPVNGQVDLPLVMYPETPNPLTDVDLYNTDYVTKTSSPVSFYAAAGTTIIVNSFTVTQDGQANPLDMRLITQANDVNKYVPSHSVHLVGKAPFRPTTKYNVSFNGTVNGKGVSKTWSFTTGNSLNIGGGAKQ